MSKLDKNSILIYSDGACSGNPGRGGWGTIILTPDQKVRELGAAEAQTTNNRMEITAALKGLEYCEDDRNPILVITDSTYLIRGITQWIFGWMKRGWLSAEGQAVANQDLWEELFALVQKRKTTGLEWRYARGHSGVPGNERCDEIAVAFTQGQRPILYDGPLTSYSLDIAELPVFEPLPEMKNNNGEKKAPFSYLSYVNGTLKRHASWADCEANVKGRPNAKFKKAMSPQEEQEIAKSWGAPWPPKS